MATPSLFPMFLKATSGDGPPVQTFTSEPIQLDIDTTGIVSLEVTADAVAISIQEIPITLDLSEATITAQMAGQLEIAVAPISLEIEQC